MRISTSKIDPDIVEQLIKYGLHPMKRGVMPDQNFRESELSRMVYSSLLKAFFKPMIDYDLNNESESVAALINSFFTLLR